MEVKGDSRKNTKKNGSSEEVSVSFETDTGSGKERAMALRYDL